MDINREAILTIDSSTVNPFTSSDESMAMKYEVFLTAVSKYLYLSINNLNLMLGNNLIVVSYQTITKY